MFLLAQLPKDELVKQLGNGLILMVLGMAIVFVFLTILILTTKLASKVVKNIEAKKPVAPVAATQAKAAPASAKEAEIAVAIAAALARSKN